MGFFNKIVTRLGIDVRYGAMLMVLEQVRSEVQECVDAPPSNVRTPAQAYAHVIWALDSILTMMKRNAFHHELNNRYANESRVRINFRAAADKLQ